MKVYKLTKDHLDFGKVENLLVEDRKNKLNTNSKCLCHEDASSQFPIPKVWNDLRQQNVVCDGVICSSDGLSFPIHRAIVSASVPKLKRMFIRESELGFTELEEINLSLPSTIVRSILDYIYTGNCSLTLQTVKTMLRAADIYDIENLIHECCSFLVQGMTPENCIGLFKTSYPYLCSTLEKKARNFIYSNFPDILEKSLEVWTLSAEELQDILKSDDLNVNSESVVFDTIVRWVDQDPETRRAHLGDLIAVCPRYGLMRLQDFCDTVIKNKYVSADSELQQQLQITSLSLQNVGSRNALETSDNNMFARPRIPHNIVFAIGGWSNGNATNFVETYDTRADRWFPSSDADSSPRAYHGICVLNNVIYLIGGFNGTDHFNTVRCYDPMTHQWSDRACMYNARCYVSVCVLGGKIYAMGGFDGRTRLDTAERFEPSDNQWERLPSMHCHRSDASATTYNQKIYVAGGFNGWEVLSSVEVYDPDNKMWTFVQSMNIPRSGVSLLTHKGRIYALGGFNGSIRLNSVEAYDPEHSLFWDELPQMFTQRSNFAAVVVDDMIFVIGGFNGTTTIPFVECFDVSLNEWYDAANMNLNRSALAACVVGGLPNAREYSYLSKIPEVSQIVNSDTSEQCQ